MKEEVLNQYIKDFYKILSDIKEELKEVKICLQK